MIDNNIYVKIVGSASYLPGAPIPRSDLENYLGKLDQAPPKVKRWLGRISELMDELIETEFFHLAIDPETRQFTEDNVTMSTKAASAALKEAGLEPSEVDLIVYGSPHQDQMPTTSVRIQEALGIGASAEISVHANCTSAYKSLLLGTDLIRNGRYRNALVVSSNISSSELVAEYYNQPLITKEEVFLRYFLSDGAAALVLKASDEDNNGLYIDYNYIESIGGHKPSAMGNKRPARYMNPRDEFDQGLHHLSQMFQAGLRENFHDPDGSVFYKGLSRMLKLYPIDINKIKYFQVNFPSKHISSMIMDECAALGINPSTLYTRMATMGYPGPPMALITLDRIRHEEVLHPGDIILSFVTEVSKFMQAGYIVHQA